MIETFVKLPISQRWDEGDAYTAEVREGRVEIEVTRAAGSLSELAANLRDGADHRLDRRPACSLEQTPRAGSRW